MRRQGYNTLSNNLSENEGIDVVDGKTEEDPEEGSLFSELRPNDGRSYKKTLCLVFTLFFGGFLTLVTSTLILLGHLDNELYADRLIPLIILGFLMFVPGAYYVRIVYCVFRGRSGYSYEQIPSCY